MQANINYFDVDSSEPLITDSREHRELVAKIASYLREAAGDGETIVWRSLINRFGGDHYRISLAVDDLVFQGKAEILTLRIPEQIRFLERVKRRSQSVNGARPTDICRPK
ncbi:MAG: hypothetical protein IPN69_08125 [Acidobacteria bacterium]|nr:hypothetical protein [Acidobacteriota bacterium]